MTKTKKNFTYKNKYNNSNEYNKKNKETKKNTPLLPIINKLNKDVNWKQVDGNRIFFVHIGKTGGITIDHELNKYKLQFQHIHCEKPPYHPNYRYIISIRDPINQTISAFNWRYAILVDKVANNSWKSYSYDFIKEKEILKKYKTINAIAELLYDKNGKKNTKVCNELKEIYHVKFGTTYYLKELLQDIKKEQIIAVVTQEHLEEDMKKYFGIEMGASSATTETSVTSSSKHGYDTELSELGRKNLKKFLDSDYKLLSKLKKIFDFNIIY